MARMTAQDMVTEVRLHLGGETDETVTDNQILRWLNRSYVELASSYRFDELETSTTITTSSGTAEYTLSVADVLTIISVKDTTNKVQLYPASRFQYDRWTQGNESSITGTPIYWFISGTSSGYRQVTLYPTPAGTYTLTMTYRKKPTELVLSPSATTSVLLEPWDDALILKAVGRGWRALGDDDKSYKAILASREAEKAAIASTFTSSHVPLQFGSIVGGAL